MNESHNNQATPDLNNDPLHQFLLFWLKNREFSPPVDAQVSYFNNKVVGSVLYRRGNFQVQLFTVAPYIEIPDHIHPNMDSYEVHVGGDIAFRINGAYNQNMIAGLPGVARVLPTDFHGGSFGKNGGLFLSVQHWINGVTPSSAGEDWAFKDRDETDTNYPDDMAAARYSNYYESQLLKHFTNSRQS